MTLALCGNCPWMSEDFYLFIMAYFLVQNYLLSFFRTTLFIVFYCSSEHCKGMETRRAVKSLYVAIWLSFIP